MAWTDETSSGLEATMDEAPHNHEWTERDTSASSTARDAETSVENASADNTSVEHECLDDATQESAQDETQDQDESTADSPAPASLRAVWLSQRARLVRTATIALTLAALALALPSLMASNGPRRAAQVQPTAKPQPTATASPTPTLIPGFQFVADTEDGFTLQAPQNWTCAQTNPGIECRDNADTPNYKAQVQLPGDWTVPGGQPNADDASPWVNYALNAFSETPGQVFERVPGPSSVVTINGVRWQTGGGLISVDAAGGQDGTPTAT